MHLLWSNLHIPLQLPLLSCILPSARVHTGKGVGFLSLSPQLLAPIHQLWVLCQVSGKVVPGEEWRGYGTFLYVSGLGKLFKLMLVQVQAYDQNEPILSRRSSDEVLRGPLTLASLLLQIPCPRQIWFYSTGLQGHLPQNAGTSRLCWGQMTPGLSFAKEPVPGKHSHSFC